MIKKPTAPTTSGPKRTGSMTPRTAAVAARPSSGLKKEHPPPQKASPSPPPSSQAATRPPVSAPAAAVALTSLPDYVEHFLARMQQLSHHTTGTKCSELWRRMGTPPLDVVRAVASSDLREDPSDGSTIAALAIVPLEATATLRCATAGSEGAEAPHRAAASVTVAVDAGAPGKPMCWTDTTDGPDVVRIAALNHAGGSKAPLCVTWRGSSWSISNDALTLEGCGAQTAGGASVQRGCVSLSTKESNGSHVVVVAVAAQAATPNKAAIITSTLTTPKGSASGGGGGDGGGSDAYVHAGDESVTVIKYNNNNNNNNNPIEKSGSGRPASGAEARRRAATIDIMDGLASYAGSVDVQSKRLHGQGALSVVTGSSSSAKYDGPWVDSLRHGTTGAWRLSLGGKGGGTADNTIAATSVEYTGPWQNDARHGANGRLTIRLAPTSGGSSGGVHIDADWEHGELHNAATIATIDDTKHIATCHFYAGSLAQKAVLSFATGKFIGQWSNPKEVARVALALGKASGNGGVPPLELLMQNVASASAILTRASDAIGAIDCANRTIVNPLLADQVRGPVAEVLASNVASTLTRYAAGLMLSKQVHDAHVAQLESARKSLKKAQQDLAEQQGEVSKVEKRLSKARSDRDAADKRLQDLTAQHKSALQSLEGQGTADDGAGMDKSKLLLQSIRAMTTEKATLESGINGLVETLTQLKAEARKLAQRRDALQKEIKSMEVEAQQSLERIAAIDPLTDAQAAKLLQVEQESAAQQDKLEATRKSLADQLASIQQKVADLDNREEGALPGVPSGSDDAAEQIKAIKCTIGATKKEIEEIERLKTAEEKRAQGMAKNASGSFTTAEDYASELKRLTEGVEASKAALAMKRSEMDTLSASLAKLREGLNAEHPDAPDSPQHVCQRAELQDALQRMSELVGKTRGQMNKKMMELEHLKEEVARLERDIETAKRVPMQPSVQPQVEETQALPSPPPPRPVRAATPPPDPRIGELDAAIKAAIAKQDGLRRKQDNINERIEQLSNQKRVIEDKRDRRAKEDAEAALRASQQVSQSQDGLTAVMMDGSIPELKAFLVKMKDQNTQYESENVVLRTNAEALATAVADAKRHSNQAMQQQGGATSSVDWRTKALQDEVDAREAKINALRGELKRTHLLEAKIQSAKESIKALTQSAEIRQTQAVQIAKADMDWSASVSLARRQSSGAGRSAFF